MCKRNRQVYGRRGRQRPAEALLQYPFQRGSSRSPTYTNRVKPAYNTTRCQIPGALSEIFSTCLPETPRLRHHGSMACGCHVVRRRRPPHATQLWCRNHSLLPPIRALGRRSRVMSHRHPPKRRSPSPHKVRCSFLGSVPVPLVYKHQTVVDGHAKGHCVWLHSPSSTVAVVRAEVQTAC